MRLNCLGVFLTFSHITLNLKHIKNALYINVWMSVIPGERYLLTFVLKAAARLLRDPLEVHDLKSLLMAAQF